MPVWLNIAITSFYMLWLIAVLAFLYMIWRRGIEHTAQIEHTLIRSTIDTAKAAQNAAEAAFVLACRNPVTTTHVVEEKQGEHP